MSFLRKDYRYPIGHSESKDFRLLKEWAGWEIGYAAQLTEYRGVVFRSKSEAILARTFDLSGLTWSYEPERFSVKNWTPDFWMLRSRASLIHGGIEFVLEYKPVMPTPTYLHGLAERFHLLEDRHPNLLTFLLVGNPFRDAKALSYFYSKGKQAWVMDIPAFYERWSEAKAFRFDLPSS